MSMGETGVVVRDGSNEYRAPDLETVRRWRRENRIGGSSMVYDDIRGWIPIAELEVVSPTRRAPKPGRMILLGCVGVTVLAVIATVLLSVAAVSVQPSSPKEVPVKPRGIDLVTTYNDDGSLAITVTNHTGQNLSEVMVTGEWHFRGATKPVLTVTQDFGDISNGASVKRIEADWAGPAFIAPSSSLEWGVHDDDISRAERARRVEAWQRDRATTAEANATLSRLLDDTHPSWRVKSREVEVTVTARAERAFPRRDAQVAAERAENERRGRATMETMVRIANLPTDVGMRVTDAWNQPFQRKDLGEGHFLLASGGPDGVINTPAAQSSDRPASDDIIYGVLPSGVGFIQSPFAELAQQLVETENKVRVAWRPREEDRAAALLTISRLVSLTQALDKYSSRVGQLPKGDKALDTLVPEYVASNVLIDGWGRRFHVRVFGDAFTLASAGADGELTDTVKGDLFDGRHSTSIDDLRKALLATRVEELGHDIAYRRSHIRRHTGYYWID